MIGGAIGEARKGLAEMKNENQSGEVGSESYVRPSALARVWLTADDVAEYLGLPSRQAVYQAVRRGEVPAHRLGRRRLRFRRDELDRTLEQGRMFNPLNDC